MSVNAPTPMHPSSAVIASRNQFRHVPVAYLSVLLLLLCAVMLSALSMQSRENGWRGGIPTGSLRELVCFSDSAIRIRISITGEILFDGQRISADQLQDYAAALRARDDAAIVIVSASANVPLSRVVNVFKVLRRQRVRYKVETAFVEREATL